VAHLSTFGDSNHDMIFPYHQKIRLRISVSMHSDSSTTIYLFDSPGFDAPTTNLDIALRNAQTEFVDQEIFSLLVKEAGNLPTASARVSERLIAIDAAHGLELTFELVEYGLLDSLP
jgi:mediator of RNA polymerase II transcription subunit 17